MKPLTQLQELALPTIEWLLDPNMEARGTGRSELMAHVFIRLAMRYPGSSFKIFDHSGSRIGNDAIARRVVDLFKFEPYTKKDEPIKFRYSLVDRTITYIRK